MELTRARVTLIGYCATAALYALQLPFQLQKSCVSDAFSVRHNIPFSTTAAVWLAIWGSMVNPPYFCVKDTLEGRKRSGRLQAPLKHPQTQHLSSVLHARSNALLIIALGDDGEPVAYEVLPPDPATEPLVSCSALHCLAKHRSSRNPCI